MGDGRWRCRRVGRSSKQEAREMTVEMRARQNIPTVRAAICAQRAPERCPNPGLLLALAGQCELRVTTAASSLLWPWPRLSEANLSDPGTIAARLAREAHTAPFAPSRPRPNRAFGPGIASAQLPSRSTHRTGSCKAASPTLARPISRTRCVCAFADRLNQLGRRALPARGPPGVDRGAPGECVGG